MTLLDDALTVERPTVLFEGPWPYGRELPLRISVGGWPFRKANWSQRCPSVVAQYREECAHGSMHLKVSRDGPSSYWWIIDHEDRFNPDFGRPLAHFFTDYEPGIIVKPAALAVLTMLATRILIPLAPVGL